MPAIVSVGNTVFDRETIQICAELCEEYGLSEQQVTLPSGTNEWHKEQEITEETVSEYLTQLSTGLDKSSIDAPDFEEFRTLATENPEEAAAVLTYLHEGDEPLIQRIEKLRDFSSVGTATVSVLLAGYDRQEYPLFSSRGFDTFVSLTCDFDAPNLDSMTIPEKYSTYNAVVGTVRDIIGEKWLNNVTAETVVRLFSLSTDELFRYNVLLHRMVSLSFELQDYDDDTERHIEAIRALPRQFLSAQAEKYEGRVKVNEVRYRVLEAVLADEPIDFEAMKENVRSNYEDRVLINWRDFTILGQIYVNYYKNRIDRLFDQFAEYLAEEVTVEDLAFHTVSYQGPSNYPTWKPWLALYPEEADSHKDAYQLFLRSRAEEIEYGISSGSNVSKVIETDQQPMLAVEEIVERFDKRSDRFLELNREIGIIDSENNGAGESEEEAGVPEPEEEYEDYANQLEQVGQMVFYGPPGTSKTYHAERFSRWWLGTDDSDLTIDERRDFVTFHPSFTYEDFIEGLTVDTDGGNVIYKYKDGVFKRLCQAAKENPDDRFLLVIDEINRGDLATILGELVTLLEYDKRGIETTLSHSGKPFLIPDNVYIIGTMNTADRSIALVDAAIRRRFRYIGFPPDYDLLYEKFGFENEADAKSVIKEGNDDEQVLRALSVQALEALNKVIRGNGNFGKGKQIGHAYLLAKGESDEAPSKGELVEIWRYEILPLLEEYYFGDLDRLQRDIFSNVSTDLFDWETGQIKTNIDADVLHDALQEIGDVHGQE